MLERALLFPGQPAGMVISAPLIAPGATRLFSRLWSHQAEWLGVPDQNQRDVNVALPGCRAWRGWWGLRRSELTGLTASICIWPTNCTAAEVQHYLSIHPSIETKINQAGAFHSISMDIYELCPMFWGIVVNIPPHAKCWLGVVIITYLWELFVSQWWLMWEWISSLEGSLC